MANSPFRHHRPDTAAPQHQANASRNVEQTAKMQTLATPRMVAPPSDRMRQRLRCLRPHSHRSHPHHRPPRGRRKQASTCAHHHGTVCLHNTVGHTVKLCNDALGFFHKKKSLDFIQRSSYFGGVIRIFYTQYYDSVYDACTIFADLCMIVFVFHTYFLSQYELAD